MKGEHENKGDDESEVKENKEQKQGEQGAAVPAAAAAAAAAPSGSGRARQPFTQLSQMESDMALARALQEQERAYMILRSGHEFGYRGEEESEEDESEIDEQEAGSPDMVDGSQFHNDEDYARALQEAEDRETTARMMAMAGLHDDDDEEAETEDEGVEGDAYEEDDEREDQFDEDEEVEDEEEEGEEDDASDYSEGVWQDVDPDNMSYEELIALGDVVGTQSKGLAADTIAELPVTSYNKSAQSGSSSDSEQCVICRHEYEEDELLLTLPCKHKYHSECIQKWLQINKICPVCSAEVGSSQSK